MPKPIPDGYHSVTPELTVRDAERTIEFYKKALGAKERMRVPGPDGKTIMHVELQIGDSIVMLSEEHPGMGCRAPASAGGPTIALHLYVPNLDPVFYQAATAGAQATRCVVWFVVRAKRVRLCGGGPDAAITQGVRRG